MFSAPWITGADLPDGTLVLTYDDGPGPNTLPIAEYLHAQGIAATFFVIGIQAYQQPAVLIRVRGLGHRLGNHTWTHPILPTRLTEGADIIDEVRRTAGLLGRGPIAFRPPYAEWTLDVAAALNADAALRDAHVGPVGWTVEGRDWEAWRDGHSPREVAMRYLAEIRAKRQGIVLLHDSSADGPAAVVKNRTYDLTRLLVPALRADGFTFGSLDAIC